MSAFWKYRAWWATCRQDRTGMASAWLCSLSLLLLSPLSVAILCAQRPVIAFSPSFQFFVMVTCRRLLSGPVLRRQNSCGVLWCNAPKPRCSAVACGRRRAGFVSSEALFPPLPDDTNDPLRGFKGGQRESSCSALLFFCRRSRWRNLFDAFDVAASSDGIQICAILRFALFFCHARYVQHRVAVVTVVCAQAMLTIFVNSTVFAFKKVASKG